MTNFILVLCIVILLVIIFLLVLGQGQISFIKEKLNKIKETEEKKDKLIKGKAIDYNQYHMTFFELINYILITASSLFVVGYIFYRSLLISCLLCLLSLFFIKYIRKSLTDKRKKELMDQFKEGLYSLSTSLGAGKSLEQAFKESLKDIDPNTYPLIYDEFKLIVNKIEVNETIEHAVMDLAERSHIDDIRNFADILVTCKRTEGDIISIIKRTLSIISEKIEVKREIETNIAQKKFEQKILMTMPLFIVVFLSTTSKGYLDPMYNTFTGRLVMTGALIAMIVSYIISSKIINIEV